MKPLTLLLLLLTPACFAQNIYESVNASQLKTQTGTLISSGSMCFLGTDASNTPVTYTPQGGSAISAAVCGVVTNGVVSGLNVANPAFVSPANLNYRVTILNGVTTVLTIPNVLLVNAPIVFWDQFVLSSGTATGLGNPTIPCASGATYTQSDSAFSNKNWSCTPIGVWVPQGSAPASNYNPAGVAITGGTIDGTAIGGTTPAAGGFSSELTSGSPGVAGHITNTLSCAQGSSNCYVQILLQPAGASWQISSAGSGASTLPGGIYIFDGTNVRMAWDAAGGFGFGVGNSTTSPSADPFFVNGSTGAMTSQYNLPKTLYSAAGTVLPTCAVGIKGAQTVVSDATTPTYMGAYASGGAITTAVICSFNGTTFSWLTH